MKKQARLIDMTWRCGCHMFEDGLNVVWNKCPLHGAVQELLKELRGASIAAHHDAAHPGYFYDCQSFPCTHRKNLLGKAEGDHV